MSEKVTQVTLFGPDIEPQQAGAYDKRGYIQRQKEAMGFRKATPGSDRFCGKCQFFITKHYSKKYFKCSKIGDSNSEATDIRYFKTVCDFFLREEKLNEPFTI